jgi:hypothetical protein
LKLQRSAIAPETIVAQVAANVHYNMKIEDDIEILLKIKISYPGTIFAIIIIETSKPGRRKKHIPLQVDRQYQNG